MDPVLFILLLLGSGGCATVDQSDGISIVVLNGRPLEVADDLAEGTVVCADEQRPHPASERRLRPLLPSMSLGDHTR